MAVRVGLVSVGVLIGVALGAALGIHASSDSSSEPAPVVDEVATPEPPYGIFDRLAACEATSNWHIRGRLYSGGLQMDAVFWATHGGLEYAPTPADATRGEQIQVAINGRDGLVGRAQGWAAWPVCSRRLGLR